MKVAYSDLGVGKAIVLLHGFLEDMRMWHEIQVKLSTRHRVISIDLLGHGKTGNLGYIHTMEDQAQMVFTLLKSLRLRKFTFIGHSMGGYISLAYAEKHADQLRGICLMNSSPLADGAEKRLNRDRAINAVKHNKDMFIKMAIPNLFSETNKTRFNNDVEQLIKQAKKLTLQGIVASLEGMKIRKDRTRILSTATFNKLMVIGLQDPVIDPDLMNSIALKTKSDSLILPGGHMSHIENTAALMARLMLFANKV